MIFFVWFFIFCLFVFVFITFKASPPHPQKVHFYQLIFFFNLPHFYKDSQIQSMECLLCALCPRAPPLPPLHRPGPPKVQGTSYLGLGGAGGNLGMRTPGRGLQAAPAPGRGSPGPPPAPGPARPPPV